MKRETEGASKDPEDVYTTTPIQGVSTMDCPGNRISRPQFSAGSCQPIARTGKSSSATGMGRNTSNRHGSVSVLGIPSACTSRTGFSTSAQSLRFLALAQDDTTQGQRFAKVVWLIAECQLPNCSSRQNVPSKDTNNPLPVAWRAIVPTDVKEFGGPVTQGPMQPSAYPTNTRPCLSTVASMKSSRLRS